MLPLKAPLRLIGGTTDFKMYYSLYVKNVYICVIIALSLKNFLSIKFFHSKKISYDHCDYESVDDNRPS